ncbi:hypothetical protein [Nocardia concava]|nr:hypothetical protein [Nocardia concava]
MHDQFAEAARLHRLPFSYLPQPDPRKPVAERIWSAVVELTH